MKKAQWLKKPARFEEYLLHTAGYINEDRSEVYFTIGETDDITLSYSKDDSVSVSFIFLHTPGDRIIFRDGEVDISFFSFKARHNMHKSIKELKIHKDCPEIVFSADNTEILRINNPAFLSSASFGFYVEGHGGVRLTVW